MADKTKKDRHSEVAIYTLEEIQKLITGFMPGAHVIEGFWNYRNGLKQKRLMDFVAGLKTMFEEEIGKSAETFNFENEDFIDVFDSIMLKVQSTKSELKLKHFQRILLNSALGKTEMADVFLDITMSLNDMQIKMIEYYSLDKADQDELNQKRETAIRKKIEAEKFANELNIKAQNGNILPNESIANAEFKVMQSTRDLIEIETIIGYQKSFDEQKPLGLSMEEFDFFRQSLISKAILKEDLVPVLGGNVPITSISQLGKNYLEFVKNDF